MVPVRVEIQQQRWFPDNYSSRFAMILTGYISRQGIWLAFRGWVTTFTARFLPWYPKSSHHQQRHNERCRTLLLNWPCIGRRPEGISTVTDRGLVKKKWKRKNPWLVAAVLWKQQRQGKQAYCRSKISGGRRPRHTKGWIMSILVVFSGAPRSTNSEGDEVPKTKPRIHFLLLCLIDARKLIALLPL